MKNSDKQSLAISIENSIDFIESHLDSADKTIAFILKSMASKILKKRASIHFKIFSVNCTPLKQT